MKSKNLISHRGNAETPEWASRSRVNDDADAERTDVTVKDTVMFLMVAGLQTTQEVNVER